MKKLISLLINFNLNQLSLRELRLTLAIILLFLLTSCTSNTAISTHQDPTLIFSVEGDFEDVKEDLIMAIEGQGAVISYTAHSSSMFNRTALTLNITQPVYRNAEILLFCKAEISHKMVQANPHSLALCPYPIAIYTLTESPKIVYLSIKIPPRGFIEYQAVHELLTKIIHETIQF